MATNTAINIKRFNHAFCPAVPPGSAATFKFCSDILSFQYSVKFVIIRITTDVINTIFAPICESKWKTHST